MAQIYTTIFIDTESTVSNMMDELNDLPSTPPPLFIDLEGVNLGRHGAVSILQIFVSPKNCVYLVDVFTLRDKAFSTPGKKGLTLKDILQTPTITKVFFDVRNDSDALFHHFQISLTGVHDLQLMELATRKFAKKFVNGLSRCIEHDAGMTTTEKSEWKDAKERGLNLFAPERGGSYEVFNQRPLTEAIKLYCTQDVMFLPRLWSCYHAKMTPNWWLKVEDATKERITQSQRSDYNPKGPNRALAPAGWA
jgi:exonuclease 3'-5' domain-containing protein 1